MQNEFKGNVVVFPGGRDGNGGAGDGGGTISGMEKRVSDLEGLAKSTNERVINIERDVAVMRSDSARYATKEDLHKEITASTRWFVTWVTGLGAVLVAAVYFIARHVP